MYTMTNTLLNVSPIALWCAYSAPDPNGGKWDIWKVRLLRPGFKSSALDIDYISPSADGYTINQKSGWWKLEQSGSFFICKNMTSTANDLLLSSTRGSVALPYEEWARGEIRTWTDKLLRRGVDSQAEIDKQKAEWENLKDWAAALE
ncbi:MAG: hypothetical protein ACKN9T_11660 [Candidatus Methylumidiphilus sp.]